MIQTIITSKTHIDNFRICLLVSTSAAPAIFSAVLVAARATAAALLKHSDDMAVCATQIRHDYIILITAQTADEVYHNQMQHPHRNKLEKYVETYET